MTTPQAHGAAQSAVGYQYQTEWCLLDLLRRGEQFPDAAISLELLDDVAWDEDGTAVEKIQVKHKLHRKGSLGDQSTDLWKTIQVWLDEAAPGDPKGPRLMLVTTAGVAENTVAAALGPVSPDHEVGLARLEAAANASSNKDTEKTRATFLAMPPAARSAFVSRITVVGNQPHVTEIGDTVHKLLWLTLPSGEKAQEVFTALLWRWWAGIALDLLTKKRHHLSVGEVSAAIRGIRDQFGPESLPTTVELKDLDEDAVIASHQNHVFVHQMNWVNVGTLNLQRAIIDYHRAITQATAWIDNDLIGLHELENFEANLKDEWDRAFGDMLEDLQDRVDGDDPDVRALVGRDLLRALRESTTVSVRSRYNEPFFARGVRHNLADRSVIGWHPDFEALLAALVGVETA